VTKLLAHPSGKLVVIDGKLTTDFTCCDKKFFILIYNSNSVRDDNFKVVLNGADLVAATGGPFTIDNNSNTCTGRFFAEDGSITAANFPSVVACATPNFQSTLVDSTADMLAAGTLLMGNNVLRIQSIQQNNTGNFGTVKVGFAVRDGATRWKVCYLLLDALYSFLDGQGQNFNFVFPAVP